MIDTTVQSDFEVFVATVEPGLRRALVGHMAPSQVSDALAEAFAYAWEHWDRVQGLDNPGGFLFRVAQSRIRVRRDGVLPDPDHARLPQVEPGLGAAMRALPTMQRSAVWLVHGCGWTYAETGESLGISPSAVGTHLARGMQRLRSRLGADQDG